jgi:hypothetical protein
MPLRIAFGQICLLPGKKSCTPSPNDVAQAQ